MERYSMASSDAHMISERVFQHMSPALQKKLGFIADESQRKINLSVGDESPHFLLIATAFIEGTITLAVATK
jgi:hypothetical protein